MEGDNFVVMWQDSDGRMVNAEQEPPTDRDLEDSERTVLGYVDEDGNTRYITILGGFDAYDYTPTDAIEAYVDSDPDHYAPMMPGQA